MVQTSTLIYLGHFFSSWGDRMWHFAIPLFLFDLDKSSLTLSAIYGLTLACTVLLFGPLVGEWIDGNKRLYAARVCLLIQNVSVMLSALILVLNYVYSDKTQDYIIWIEIGAIGLGAIGNLASVATGIIIQKDWIVVVSGGKEDYLADLNSMVRRIDLASKILAPMACGQIMAFASLTGGAIFIVCWNAVSMVVEYMLLRTVYFRTPELAKTRKTANDNAEEMQDLNAIADEEDKGDSPENEQNGESKPKKAASNKSAPPKKNKSVFRKMFGVVFHLKDGWKLYSVQPIALPCVGFSFLYMTILGFGYITTTYAYSQCFSEFMVALLQAGAAVTGIIATFLYPVMREKLGLIRTGLFNAFFQIAMLIPCIISIFVIGSPFMQSATPEATTLSTPVATSSSGIFTTSSELITSTENSTEAALGSELFLKCLEGVTAPSSYLSVSLLLGGIILARVGLWGFDLTITQLIQENVAENERGVFNGVQSSLNNFMDLLRFGLVLCLPLPSQFGYLIFVSSAFVCCGYILYMIYARKIRGHLLPGCKGSSKPETDINPVA